MRLAGSNISAKQEPRGPAANRIDTELQELGAEHSQGGRTVDKPVKVRRLDGQEQWLFIHLEIQLKQVSDEARLRQATGLAITEPTLERFLTKF